LSQKPFRDIEECLNGVQSTRSNSLICWQPNELLCELLEHDLASRLGEVERLYGFGLVE